MRAGAIAPVLPPPPGGSVLQEAALPPASPERPSPPPRRPSRARTSGRGGVELTSDPYAGRRSVDMPPATAINRMNVFGHPDLGFAEVDRRKVTLLAKTAVLSFNRRASFCRQAQVSLEQAVLTLEYQEPRLAVCTLSCGAWSLLSKAANNQQPSVKLKNKRRGRWASAAAQAPMTVAVPAPATAQREFYNSIN